MVSVYSVVKESVFWVAGKAHLSIYDGVVKSPIYCVVGFLQTLDIPHVWSSTCKKRYALKSTLIGLSHLRLWLTFLRVYHL